MLGVVKTRTIYGHCAKKNGTSFPGPAASIAFSISSWLRGVDLNHRPLGYEPNELPDCSTPHFDHNVYCICGQTTTSVANSPAVSNLGDSRPRKLLEAAADLVAFAIRPGNAFSA
jgi:hypothetical protein